MKGYREYVAESSSELAEIQEEEEDWTAAYQSEIEGFTPYG